MSIGFSGRTPSPPRRTPTPEPLIYKRADKTTVTRDGETQEVTDHQDIYGRSSAPINSITEKKEEKSYQYKPLASG